MGCRSLSSFAGLSLLVLALTACEPPPPRLQLVVEVNGPGPDTNPGDGVCASANFFTFGRCTLPAAIEEANATDGGVDILLPEGPLSGVTATVTGDVVLRPATTDRAYLSDVHLTVAPGAALRAERVETTTFVSSRFQVSFDVQGTLVLDRSLVISVAPVPPEPPSRPAVRIHAGASAAMVDSVVISDSDEGAVANAGTLYAIRSTLSGSQGCALCRAAALVTAPGAASHLLASGIHTTIGETGYSNCSGLPPVSHGFVHFEMPCGSAPAVGDSVGGAGWTIEPFTHVVTIDPASPLVDAIPLGEAGCGTSAVDLFGNPRGVDGDGDGTGGCDIGAVERQP
jgi:hypothetical protein